ncbi:MAG: ABC transporter substrate-binding protein [Nitrospiraceae bacterium]|nr:ABC transporter substrate-binding protein [Nitrospiraceae bacterium]
MKDNKLSLVLLLILVFSVFSTWYISEKTTTTTSSQLIQSVQEQKHKTRNNTVIVTDSAGRTVTLERSPKRVIVLTNYWAEVLQCLGFDNRIVGIGNSIFYDQHLLKDIRKKPIVGSVFNGLNWETIAGLKPNLIITDWYGGKYGDKKIIKKAEELGISIISLEAKTVEDNIKAVKLLEKIFGKEKKAKELSSWMQNKLNKVKKIASQIPANKRKNVIFISVSKNISAPISVYAKGSDWASTVEFVGAHNLAFDKNFSTPWPKLDLEKLIAYWGDKTDVIIVTSFNQKKLEKVVNKIKNDPRWREIKAVKEGHVYGILAGSNGFLDWGPRAIVGVYQIGKAIYPEYYPNWKKIADELLRTFYKESFYKTVKDSFGREVKLPKHNVKAVVLNSNYELIVYALGAYDHVVGVSMYHSKNPIMKVLTKEGKISGNLPSLGSFFSGVNTEELVRLKPDCVITWAYNKKDIKKIENIEKMTGIPVIAVDIKSIDDFYNAVRLFGNIFNKEERAEEIIKRIQDEISSIVTRTSKVPANKKVKTLLAWEINKNEIGTCGQEGVDTQILRMINTIPVTENFTQKYPKISLEQLYALNPDVVILFYIYKRKPSPKEIYNDPAWKDLKAVKEKKIYDLRGYPHTVCGCHPAGIPLRVLALAKCSYPEFLKNINFKAKINELFQEFYGISYTKVER